MRSSVHMLLRPSRLGTISLPVTDHAATETGTSGRSFRAGTDPVPFLTASVPGAPCHGLRLPKGVMGDVAGVFAIAVGWRGVPGEFWWTTAWGAA